jgi:hypothetical protein
VSRSLSILVAAIFLMVAMVTGYRSIGWPPVVIVGGSGIVAMVLWVRTYLPAPMAPEIVLPPFLLTVAALEIHMTEEYLTGFGPAMSRLFNVQWTEFSFLMIFAFAGPVIYALTALGLFRRVPLAGFFLCFILIGPGVAEFTHFIFPGLRPAIEPAVAGMVSARVADGPWMRDMPNFYVGTTGRYYFPGMYTAILPMIPGIYGIVTLLRARRAQRLTDGQQEVR